VGALIDTLRRLHVSTVVDVRMHAISRKPGLSKTALSLHLAKADIGYVHLPALGNPKDNRTDYRLGLPAARRRFRHRLKNPTAQAALKEAAELASQGVVALLCFEARHDTCHRACVADALRRRLPEASTIRA
jgi:uncharacterized protein (DUF488 family)